MLPSRASVIRALGYSAGGWLVLAMLRTSLRVAAIPRPPAEAAAVLGQVLLASLPWLFAAPVVVALVGRGRLGLGTHLPLAAALSVADAAWAWLVLPLAGYPITLPAGVFYLVRLDQALFLYLGLTGVGLALRHRRRLHEAKVRAERLAARLLKARLHVLELQLHPHFLFNTLNAVSELVHRDAVAARATLASLRELLTRSLDQGTGQEVTLREELTLLEPYVRVQRTRFAGSLDVVLDAEPQTLDAYVPRLVLQPLVENAIRHGTARRVGPGRVTVRSRAEGERLVIEVEDDGRGPEPGPRREGLGLGNTRARLEQVHGDRARLALLPGTSRGAVARLECPLITTAATRQGAGGEEELPPTPAPLPTSRLSATRVALGAAAAWLLVALVGAYEDLAAAWLMGETASLGELLPQRLIEATLWLGLTAPVVLVATRLARSALVWPWLIASHVVAALATAAAHLGLVRALTDAPMAPNLVATLLVNDLCVYAALAAGAHAWSVRESAAANAAAAARLDAELAAARLEQLRWHIQPETLFAALDRIGELAALDPDRADELTGRLGEQLRLMLESRTSGAPTRSVELSVA